MAAKGSYVDFGSAIRDTSNWISRYYNVFRPHTNNGGVPPCAYVDQWKQVIPVSLFCDPLQVGLSNQQRPAFGNDVERIFQCENWIGVDSPGVISHHEQNHIKTEILYPV